MIRKKAVQVLLVEDDDQHFELTRNLLSESRYLSYTVTRAASREEALDLIESDKFDVFLLDFNLGNANGLDVMREAIEMGCHGPFIFLTGSDSQSIDLLAMRTGAADFLVKDEITSRSLERSIRYALNQASIIEKLHRQAFYDGLTGLANRALLLDRLEHAIRRYQRSDGPPFAVLFMDLDRFKFINDSLGHLVGDMLLKEVSLRLTSCVRPGDTVARLGGDEFTLLLENAQSVADAEAVAKRIQQALKEPVMLDKLELVVTASVGIVMSSPEHPNAQALLRDADTAMYKAKEGGKARSALFDPSMHLQVKNVLKLEHDLRRAIEKEELDVVYQPIVSLRDQELTGFEALLRWQHHKDGNISPDKFIPLAEETGLIFPIGEWVLKKACSQLKAWQTSSTQGENLKMNVNVSSRQFTDKAFAQRVQEILCENDVKGDSLQLEITESVFMDNVKGVTDMLESLKAMDINLYIDDFGTGYSSLSHLHNFPIDTIKIDRSFVRTMHSDGKKSEIVRSIIALAHQLGKKVVAEGVERSRHRQQLRAMRCDYAQGYFYSRPGKRFAARDFQSFRAAA